MTDTHAKALAKAQQDVDEAAASLREAYKVYQERSAALDKANARLAAMKKAKG